MFYYYKKTQIYQGNCFCVYQSNTKLTEEEIESINKKQNNLLIDIIEYESDTPLSGYPIIENDILREANDKELVDLGLLTLKEGELINGNNKIIYVPRPKELGYAYEWKYNKWIVNEEKLPDGVYYNKEKNRLEKVDKPQYGVKLQWNKEKHIYEDVATLEERKDCIGAYIGDDLLPKVLAKGCSVEIRGTLHTQVLDSRKLLMLTSAGAGMLMSSTFSSAVFVDQMPWSFNDDGSDSLILTKEEFSSLSMQCLDFVSKCYIVADILKSRDRLDLNIGHFEEELKKLNSKSLREIMQ